MELASVRLTRTLVIVVLAGQLAIHRQTHVVSVIPLAASLILALFRDNHATDRFLVRRS